MDEKWHALALGEVFTKLRSGETGLSEDEAKTRLKKFGLNTLPEAKRRSVLIIFFSQFQSPLIYILLAACVLVFVIGEMVDGAIILAILLFNAVVGTVQEGKAENTLAILKKFVETNATVLRGGKEFIIPDKEVVPGDTLIIGEGDKVPADARIISAQNLKVDEASFTGESGTVHKSPEDVFAEDALASDQKNMLFKGTHAVLGHALAIAVRTGVSTEIGKIAQKISSIDTEIPLKKNIRYLSHAIILVVVFVSTIIFVSGIALKHTIAEMFTTVVSLSVSIIPEGLPIVMTLVLATGVWRMSKRNALVKKLQAVEALGQARVIAVDKTGTITRNELVVRKVWAGGRLFDVGGVGYEPKGEIRADGEMIDAVNHTDLLFAGKVATLCSGARLLFSENDKTWRIVGDPTEGAMLVLGEKIGFNKDNLAREAPVFLEMPFDYKLKYRATAHEDNGERILIMMGAPEAVLSVCSGLRTNAQKTELDEAKRGELEKTIAGMSEEGLRVLAVAVLEDAPVEIEVSSIRDLTLVGFFGMKDALRVEVEEAMRQATEAGIKVVMITGDHYITARAIAREAGIYKDGDAVLSGAEIEKLSDEELSEKLENVSVFARVAPDHKMRIINAFKRRGEIIAMTGDGVNDAPSLVAADLGVAMGKIGTEVAKEASDIVLLDDNFGSIVGAVEEGRSIYKTIKKVLLYLFAGSASQVFAILAIIFMGYPIPLLPAQIIWLNFVTDGFLDVSLAMEPKEEGLLRGNFEKPKKYLVDKPTMWRVLIMSLPLSVGAVLIFREYVDINLAKASTMVLTMLAMGHWFNAWSCRSDKKSIFGMSPFSNKFLAIATIIIVFLQILAVYNPVMQSLLRTVALAPSEWLIMLPLALSPVVFEEIRKYFQRKKDLQMRY